MTGPWTVELDALEGEARSLGGWLATLAPENWRRPTRCEPMDVRMLTCHLLSQLDAIPELSAQPHIDAEPKKDRLSWWDYDPLQDGAEVLFWAKKATTEYPAGSLAGEFHRATTGAIDAARQRIEKGWGTFLAGENPMRFPDFLATRVLEMTIHGMDLRDAMEAEPAPTPEALDVTGDVLRGLLGRDLRPTVTDLRLCLIGTGRAEPDGAERAALGGLTEKFPLLA